MPAGALAARRRRGEAGPAYFSDQASAMDNESILARMEEAAQEAGIEIRYENLADEEITIGSGLCHVHQKPLLIIDKRLGPKEKWKILAKQLKAADLEDLYLPPLVRELIEQMDL